MTDRPPIPPQQAPKRGVPRKHHRRQKKRAPFLPGPEHLAKVHLRGHTGPHPHRPKPNS